MTGLKLNGYTAQKPPPADMSSHIRKIAVKIVYAKYNRTGKPSTLREIADKVKQQINTQILNGEYKKTWPFPSKRTIDRRVNEACEAVWYDDDVPRLAAVRAGYYTINPARFVEP